MTQQKLLKSDWEGCRIGITGANGSLGRALIKKLRTKGAFVIGLTHRAIQKDYALENEPQQWVRWRCGEEDSLDNTLNSLDILILNHGINPKGNQSTKNINLALDVNALSTWRLIERFEELILKSNNPKKNKEIWINTSEAEIQPALSPAYEISKKLIGELISVKWSNLNKETSNLLVIRKMVLGPFKSNLNSLGIMSPDIVASLIIKQIELNFSLIIVSPNPFTYISMPTVELLRRIYYRLTKTINY